MLYSFLPLAVANAEESVWPPWYLGATAVLRAHGNFSAQAAYTGREMVGDHTITVKCSMTKGLLYVEAMHYIPASFCLSRHRARLT